MTISSKVLIGVVLGLALGYLASLSPMSSEFVRDFIKPFGSMFIKALKLVAVPLVLVSLSKGICDLKDLSKLSSMGGRTLFWYFATSFFAVVLGLCLVNLIGPGVGLSIEGLNSLSLSTPMFDPSAAVAGGPLEIFVRMVPDNLFAALGDNGALLQVIFFTVIFSVALLMLPAKDSEPVIKLISSLNQVMLKIVNMIIAVSPFAVFALMATLVVEVGDGALFKALLAYSLVLLLGMLIMLMVYPLLARLVRGVPIATFARGILPAQLVAFSTSSSMATLPVTMETVQDNLGVEDEVAAFVCPIGATVNMDATCLMQSIAAVFICQISGFDLSVTAQLTIVLTAFMASIGAAAAPSAGIVMLVMVLESVGFPSELLPLALSLILAVDRPLDMFRTVVNVSGDCCVSVLVSKPK